MTTEPAVSGDAQVNVALPRARQEDLVVTDLQDEVLVYDLTRHRAHCLNRTAARVWRHADGKKTVEQIAATLQAELEAPIDEAMVRLALRQLGRAHLLEGPRDGWADGSRQTRRDLLRKAARIGLIAAAVPAVLSLVAPTPVAAASAPCGAACANNGACTGLADAGGACIKCRASSDLAGNNCCHGTTTTAPC